MHKFFKDLSFNGGVLFLAVFLFGLIFRIIGLSQVSAWGDEVASWYFAQNLTGIFQSDSHTPIYYLLCKIWMLIFPATIVSLRYFSIFLSLAILTLSCFLINRKHGAKASLVIFSLWWLWPSMIIYSRQARHYSLYLDMTLLILVMWDQKQNLNKSLLWMALVIYQLIHPLAMIPVLFLVCWEFLKERKLRTLAIEITSIIPVIVYYLAKLISQGEEKVSSHISWISSDTFHFFKSMLILFAGDSFPFSRFYPVQIAGFIFLAVTIGLIVMIKTDWRAFLKNPWFLKAVLLFVVTELLVEFLGLFNFNLRVNRYFIFVVGFFIFSLLKNAEAWSDKEKLIRSSLVFVCLISYSFIFHKPWFSYSWDDQRIERYEEELSMLPPRETVICASVFQLNYYFNLPEGEPCLVQADKLIKNKKSFYFFDLSGNDKVARAHIINNASVESFKKFDQSVFISVSPK